MTKPDETERKLIDQFEDEKDDLLIDDEKDDGDDEADEAEIAKLIKEEDINIVPENIDVTEIDKLTGNPKPKGQCCCC